MQPAFYVEVNQDHLGLGPLLALVDRELIVMILEYSNSLLELLNQYDKLLDSPPTTIPRIFKKWGYGRGRDFSNDENFISDYLAFVLNPNINGIGIAPLQNLIKLTGIEIEFSNPKDIHIRREFFLKDNDHIDLLIEIGKNEVIGIENKIFAQESTNGEYQTERYAKAFNSLLKFSNTRVTKIILTPKGDKPHSPLFIPISYKQLLGAFRKIQYANANGDIRRIGIWLDFLTHLEDYIVNEKLEISEKSKLYRQYSPMMQDLQASYEKDKERLFNLIRDRFVEEIGEAYEYYYADHTGMDMPNTLDFWKPGWQNPGGIALLICYSIEMPADYILADSLDFSFDLSIVGNDWEVSDLSTEFVLFLQNSDHWKNISVDCKKKGINCNDTGVLAHKRYQVDDLVSVDRIHQEAFRDFLFFSEEIDFASESFIKERNNVRKTRRKKH